MMDQGKLLHKYNAFLSEAFLARIEQKTGWGKEKLKLEFQQAMLEAMAKIMMDEE